MKLRNKVLLAIIFVWSLLIALTYAGSHVFLLKSFLKLENAQAQRDTQRVDEALGQVNYALGTFTGDWAHWTDAYNYVLGANPTFPTQNMTLAAYTNSNINLIAYVDKEGKPAIKAAADLKAQKLIPFPVEFDQYLKPNSPLVNITSHDTTVRSYVLLSSGLMMVAASGLSDTDNKKPIEGALITGRYVNPELLKNIADTTKLDVSLFTLPQIEKNPQLNNIFTQLKADDDGRVEQVQDKLINGYLLISDVYNKPIAMVRISAPRVIYAIGEDAITSYLLTFITLAFVMTLFLWWLLRIVIVQRLEKLDKQVSAIGAQHMLTNRVDETSNDELSSVAKKINDMLDTIQTSHDQLEQRVHERTQALEQANIKLQREISERRAIEEELLQSKEHLAYLAHHDSLTGLPNRVMFNNILNNALNSAKRHNKHLAVLFVDLDRFKNINDALGHDIGDEVLQETAHRFSSILRSSDTIARLGGDEFIILITELQQDAKELTVIAEKILSALTTPIFIRGRELFLMASIGISVYPKDGNSLEDLQKNADMAMYRAKKNGGNQYYFYTEEMHLHARKVIELESDLRKAVTNQEFIVFYQPKLALNTREIIGVEALIRWQHPEFGLTHPSDFIALAEENGLIVQIGEWVLRQACRDCKSWQDQGYAPISVAVNISGIQFQQSNLVQMISSVLVETKLPPQYLELEITESVIMSDVENAIIKLNEIKKMGVSVALDDFGTGYSSMSYLKQFPINILKIDRSFINGIPDNRDDAAIAVAIIALAHSLSLKVIAEGVENAEQLNYLVEQGCDIVQGYFFSKPVPMSQLLLMLARNRVTGSVAKEIININ